MQQNAVVRVEGKKGISNSSYTQYNVQPIDKSIFDVPKANCQDSSCTMPEIGPCRQFGVDPSCDMADYDATGDDFFF